MPGFGHDCTMKLVRKGDAHAGSMGIGGITPERRDQIARFGTRVVLAAILANLMSGTVAGMLV